MANKSSDLETILCEYGHSITKQRLLVFNLLVDQEPMTMYELYDRAKGRLDRASTYRIIALFEELGIVQRINIGWKYKIELSDKFAEHHHHLACVKCGKVTPISEDDLERFIATTTAAHRFTPVSHQVEIQGRCWQCTSNSN